MIDSRSTDFHDPLCASSIGDGECNCIVAQVAALTAERDRYRAALEEILATEDDTCAIIAKEALERK